MLLEICHELKTPTNFFNAIKSSFSIKRYYCFASNGSLNQLVFLPSELERYSEDPMLVGLSFLLFLLQEGCTHNVEKGDFHYSLENRFKRGGLLGEIFRKSSLSTEDLLFKDIEQACGDLFTHYNQATGDILLVVDEAHHLVDCLFKTTISTYNLLQLLRHAIGYFNTTKVSLGFGFCLCVSSTSLKILDFLPSDQKLLSKSSSFRISTYSDYFASAAKKKPIIITHLDTFHMFDLPEQPYTHGRPMWYHEFKHAKNEINLFFVKFALDKLCGGSSSYESLLSQVEPNPDAFAFALLFHRISLLDQTVQMYSPSLVGTYLVPADEFHSQNLSFTLLHPSEPALVAASAWLVLRKEGLKKLIWKALTSLPLPLAREKGNCGELFALEALLLHFDEIKFQTCKFEMKEGNSWPLPTGYEDEIEFFSKFLHPISVNQLFEHFQLPLNNIPHEVLSITISAISCKRTYQFPSESEYKKLYSIGIGHFTPPFTPKHDAVFYCRIEIRGRFYYFPLRIEVKYRSLTRSECIAILKLIPLQPGIPFQIALLLVDSEENFVEIYKKEENLTVCMICLTFTSLGIPPSQSTTSDMSSKSQFGHLAAPPPTTLSEAVIQERFSAQFALTPLDWEVIRRNISLSLEWKDIAVLWWKEFIITPTLNWMLLRRLKNEYLFYLCGSLHLSSQVNKSSTKLQFINTILSSKGEKDFQSLKEFEEKYG